MPTSPPKPCIVCRCLVRDGTSRCDQHKVQEGSFADKRRGSRHERGYGSAWDRIAERIRQRDNCLCQTCWREGIATFSRIVDHIVNKANDGTDDDSNLEVICAPHHKAKTARESAAARGAAKTSDASKSGTVWPAKFSRAGVAEGGVPQ